MLKKSLLALATSASEAVELYDVYTKSESISNEQYAFYSFSKNLKRTKKLHQQFTPLFNYDLFDFDYTHLQSKNEYIFFGKQGKILIYNLKSEKLVQVLNIEGYEETQADVIAICLLPNDLLAVIEDNAKLYFYDIKQGVVLPQQRTYEEKAIHSMRYIAELDILLAGCKNGSLAFFKLNWGDKTQLAKLVHLEKTEITSCYSIDVYPWSAQMLAEKGLASNAIFFWISVGGSYHYEQDTRVLFYSFGLKPESKMMQCKHEFTLHYDNPKPHLLGKSKIIDDNRFVSSCFDNTITMWDYKQKRVLYKWTNFDVHFHYFSIYKNLFLVVNLQNLKVFDITEDKELWKSEKEQLEEVEAKPSSSQNVTEQMRQVALRKKEYPMVFWRELQQGEGDALVRAAALNVEFELDLEYYKTLKSHQENAKFVDVRLETQLERFG